MTGAPARLSIAIAAMGGQGGGVLADWLVSMAEANGYGAQTTSVPGVAQRTGATIYYLELYPNNSTTTPPVLALMPVPGDVDIVIAAELAEAGRAVQRGIVTPDRTTFIASSHRHYTVLEKSGMGDGRTSSEALLEKIAQSAKQLVCFDMQSLAEQHHTVISATLFGALAGSNALPFSRDAFESAISGTGKSVSQNIAAFNAAYDRAGNNSPEEGETITDEAISFSHQNPDVAALLRRIETDIPAAVQGMAMLGASRLVDYQDCAYANVYLDHLISIKDLDNTNSNYKLTAEVAQHLALWMSYEDTIRVADLKIRRARFERCREEVRAGEDEIVRLVEFMHPRIEEIADTLPTMLGNWLMSSPRASAWISRTLLRERKIKTTSLSGFLLLYALASLRGWRRKTYRYQLEQRRIGEWLVRIAAAAPQYGEAAIEIAKCQNLVKGYGDTHARGLKNFYAIMQVIDDEGLSPSIALRIRSLREAALADEQGTELKLRIDNAA